MQRRSEIIFAILSWLAQQSVTVAKIPTPLDTAPETAPDVIEYHVELYCEAGFIRELPGSPGMFRLTWVDHDNLAELQAARK